jgi:hypothetical protein
MVMPTEAVNIVLMTERNTMSKIRYKGGYKYQLFEDYKITVSINISQHLVIDKYLDLENGVLQIFKGYAWDGASGPAIDTKSIMRGSLIHDALYQLMRTGKRAQTWRKQADKVLLQACLEDGMWRIRAYWVYWAVRIFAKKAAMVGTEKAVETAPRK